jgi:FMN phosphatase YigB (HAD superfamily)
VAATARLALWKDNATRQAIVRFVEQVTDADSPTFVPPAERIAVFDNDGTLWCEKPMYIQLDYILRRWVEMADANPALRVQQPWKAAFEKDYAWLDGAITKHYQGDDSDLAVVLKGLLTSFEGITVEEVAARAGEFLRTQAHPTLKRPYLQCGYAPMIELLRDLEAHGFTNYIVSGGGRDFMCAISEEIYAIPPDRVIGSSVSLEFRENGDGGDLVSKAELDVVDDGPVKPARIWSRTGRRPILAAGNSNGDIQMLQFANHPSRPSLRLLVLHDDAAREFDYVKGAEKSLELAKQYGWTVVSIKDDWTTVFHANSSLPA